VHLTVSRTRGKSAFRMVLVAGTVAAVAGITAVPASGGSTTTAWVPKHLCAAHPKPGHFACFAERLVKKQVSSTSAAARYQPTRASVAEPTLTSGPAGGFTPGNLISAYGANAAATAPASFTVAIVDAFNDPNIKSDLNFFDAQYGLPAETASSFKVLNQTGAASPLPANDAGWAGEESLDVEAVRGLCHKCNIILFEATSNSSGNLAAAVNTAAATPGVRIISNSYGGTETGSAGIAPSYDHSGIAILASTGDDGWFGWDHFNVGGSSDGTSPTPAGYPTVVAVGGTSLYLNADGTRNTEQVWNDNGPSDIYGFNLAAAMGASGGGCSTIYSPKGWQKNVAGYSQLGCNGLRSAGDIAAVADPFTGFDVYNTFGTTGTHWATIGERRWRHRSSQRCGPTRAGRATSPIRRCRCTATSSPLRARCSMSPSAATACAGPQPQVRARPTPATPTRSAPA
jgi:subtilase family serine protease